MAKDGKGYKIPENPSPAQMGCILVFYPDDPGYLAALLGAITYMGTWAAWERDPDKRAILAAAAWKEANECTLSSMSCITDLVTVLQEIRDAIANQQLTVNLDAGDIQLNLDTSDIVTAVNGVQTAIENLEFDSVMSEEDMAITINNCNCGCGCGGGSAPGNPSPPDIPGVPDDTLPPDPPQIPPDWEFDDEEAEEGYLSQNRQTICMIANYVFYSFRSLALEASEGVITTANIVQRLSAYWPGLGAGMASAVGWHWAGGVYQFAMVLASILLRLASSSVAVTASAIDSKAGEIKCAMLRHDLSLDARLALVRQLIDQMALPVTQRYALKIIAGYLPLAAIFNTVAIDSLADTSVPILEQMRANGCPSCFAGDGDDFPVQPVGYEWIRVDPPAITDRLQCNDTISGQSLLLAATNTAAWFKSAFTTAQFTGVLGVLVRVSSAHGSILAGASTQDWFSNYNAVPAGESFVFLNNGAPAIDWGEIAPITSNKPGSRFITQWLLPTIGSYQFDYWFLKVAP